jgi:general secretion pathway protein M
MIKAWCTQFWGNLNIREQRVLYVGAVGVVLYLAYMMYATLTHAVFESTQILSEKKATLVWMQKTQKQFQPSQKKTVLLDNSKALTIFSEALNKTSFHDLPYQLEQMSDGALQLLFDSVPYHAFLGWLWSMEQRYKIDIKLLNAEKTDTPGLVKVTLVVVL